jgi:hypothetical protein
VPPLSAIAIVVQAVVLVFYVMAYRVTTGEEVSRESVTVALLASPERGAVPKQQNT